MNQLLWREAANPRLRPMGLAQRIRSFFFGDRQKTPLRSETALEQAVRHSGGVIEAQAYNVLDPQNANTPYWARATGADANQTATPEYRRGVRNRARLELTNNSYAQGMITTLANDTIGTGPRLQIIPDNENATPAANRLEASWEEWAEEHRIAEKLRSMKYAKTVDGESFGVFETNEGMRHPVKLDLGVYEADYFTNPWDLSWYPGLRDIFEKYPPYDGIEFDAYGNPRRYWKLNRHPGSVFGFALTAEDFERLSADVVCHVYRVNRPGQARGMSEIVSVLDLYVDLRDYTDAAVNGAQQAASMSVGITTPMPPGQGADLGAAPCTTVEIPKRGIFNFPDGWDGKQFKVEQPTTTYPEFVKQVLREIARCLNMPFAVAAMDSSDHNYASGRLDYQVYARAVDVERKFFERKLLNRLFRAWLEEAALIPGFMPRVGQFTFRWHWDRRPFIDPQKEAAAATMLFNHGMLPVASYASEVYGLAPDEFYRQIQQDVEYRRANNLPLPSVLVTQLSQAPEEERGELA